MSLKAIAHFCAIRPFYVITAWIILMILAGFLSQQYLDDALDGGQGPTRELEFSLAKKMKDTKLSMPNARMDGITDEEFSASQQNTESKDTSRDTILVITSDNYLYPSKEYVDAIDKFLDEIQSKVDRTDITFEVGTYKDYPITPSGDGTTVIMPAPFM